MSYQNYQLYSQGGEGKESPGKSHNPFQGQTPNDLNISSTACLLSVCWGGGSSGDRIQDFMHDKQVFYH